MGKTLAVAQRTRQEDIQKALEDAFLETFSVGSDADGKPNTAGNFAKQIAKKFAMKGAKPIADAIYKFLKEANITGTVTGTLAGTCAVGPVTGTNIDIFTGTELSLV